MLNTLDDIEAAQDVMKSATSKTEYLSKVTRPKDPTDAYYEALMVNLEALTKTNDKVEWDFINKYLNLTRQDHSSMSLEQIFRVNRHGEDVTFKTHDNLKNRRMLWHGTGVAVVAAILKSGLRIMPNAGGRVGKGIYMADMHEKAAQYTRSGGGKFIMFLVEAVLGTEHTFTGHEGYLKCAPEGCDSVVARGLNQPDPKLDVYYTFDDRKVIVPQGKPIRSLKKSNFHHNEFLIYQESQHRIRYVLLFDKATGPRT